MAGGLLLGSFWGVSLVELVPPPHGLNAIELTATQVVAVDATLVEEVSEPTPPVATLSLTPAEVAAGRIRAARRQVQSPVGEMSPAALQVEQPDTGEASATHGHEASSPLDDVTVARVAPRVEVDVEPEPARVWNKTAVVRPPATPATAASPSLPSVQQQGQDAASPQKVFSPTPEYPASALREGITGRVVLRVTVDADGKVTAASVLTSSGHAILDDAALAGVQQWRFQPARRLGVAIAKDIAVPMTFQIDQPR